MAGAGVRRIFILKAILLKECVLMNAFTQFYLFPSKDIKFTIPKKYKPWKFDTKLRMERIFRNQWGGICSYFR